jgi:hypothetical protein
MFTNIHETKGSAVAVYKSINQTHSNQSKANVSKPTDDWLRNVKQKCLIAIFKQANERTIGPQGFTNFNPTKAAISVQAEPRVCSTCSKVRSHMFATVHNFA